ncbi:hypothetical protein DVJ83_18840 (plasmid) [Deinococcus wulumuqiensis]|uniref:Uncharacterized protein n=1 Tax=Deinococcus wulumuqiensis TaxID=980427 RepID=A0A345IN53_9DEIO|nr:hypothetical protein DVJ83_18840 [Deinococcus wulumuqiensis]
MTDLPRRFEGSSGGCKSGVRVQLGDAFLEPLVRLLQGEVGSRECERLFCQFPEGMVWRMVTQIGQQGGGVPVQQREVFRDRPAAPDFCVFRKLAEQGWKE